MDYTFKDWKQLLDDFSQSVGKDLDEIRRCKAEVQQLKADIISEVTRGRYVRDEERIILSAPEIIIGNVDASGCLFVDGGSTITLRANNIHEDAVGSTASIVSRAASIRHIAVDPGSDGNEAVVGQISEVISQARSVVLQSNDAKDVFPDEAAGTTSGGIYIHADKHLELEATQSSELKTEQLQDRIDDLEANKSDLKKATDNQKKDVDKIFDDIQKLMEAVEDLRGDDEADVRGNVIDIKEVNDQISLLAPVLYNAVDEYIDKVSALAETTRQLTSLKDQKSQIVTGDNFKNKSTRTGITMRGEQIGIISTDGDGNLRDNDSAGVKILANKVSINAQEKDGQLKEKGEVRINAKTIGLSTANTKMKEDAKNGDVTAEGDIIVTSKTFTIEGVDREIKDNKPEEKALTKDSKLSIRMEKTDISATDTEGKATGSISLNSKALQVKAMDVDKDKRTDNKLASGSTMLLLAEKMYVGAKDKDNKSKKLQAVSDEIGLFGDKTLEAQQDNGKAVLQLAGGNAAISGSKTQLYGATTINGKTEVKDELKAPKATIDNLEAKTSFKSSNISDGIAIPAPAVGANLSTKLKTEDAPKE